MQFQLFGIKRRKFLLNILNPEILTNSSFSDEIFFTRIEDCVVLHILPVYSSDELSAAMEKIIP